MIEFPSRRRGWPWRQDNLVLVLIIINAVVFVADLALKLNPSTYNLIVVYLGMIPELIVSEGFIWTPFTYMFVHADVMHIAFNMLTLFFIGRELERQMGSLQFLAFYLVVGLGAGLLSFGLFSITGIQNPLVGASGAIYGLLIAYACFFPWRQLLVFGILPVRAPWLVVGYAVFDLTMQLSGLNSFVAHSTHLFGLLCGFLIMLFVYRINFFSTLRR